MQDSVQVTYDKYGRMNYHPDFHGNQKQPWTTLDQKFLIENYESMGPEEISFALERTIHTVMQRACQLRKLGIMAVPKTRSWHKRTRAKIDTIDNKAVIYIDITQENKQYNNQ